VAGRSTKARGGSAALPIRYRILQERAENRQRHVSLNRHLYKFTLTGRSRQPGRFSSRAITVLVREKTTSNRFPGTDFRASGRAHVAITFSVGWPPAMPRTLRRRDVVRRCAPVVERRPRERARFSAILLAEEARVVPLPPEREERGGRWQRTKGELRVRERGRERERNDRRGDDGGGGGSGGDVDDDDDGRVVSIRGRGKPAARRPRESFFFAFSPSLPRVSSSPCPPRTTRLNIRLRFEWANACSVCASEGRLVYRVYHETVSE